MNHLEKREEYKRIIEEYKVFLEYVRTNHLDIEEVKKVLGHSISFYKRLILNLFSILFNFFINIIY